MNHHLMVVRPTSLKGLDSGRTRYRVECLECLVVIHEATTGPTIRVEQHFEDPTNLGYGRPMTDAEREWASGVASLMHSTPGPSK